MFTSPGAVAFTLFNIDIMWYGILIASGVVIGGGIAYARAPKFGIVKDHLIDVFLVAVPAGIIGARAYYVLFNWSMYAGDIREILDIRGGGLAVHGGLIFGFLAGYFMCRYRKMSFLNALDLAAPSVALAQAIGRWGNFFNSEAYGRATDLPWAVYVNGEAVHPTFLYESLWCLALFIFLLILSGRRQFEGQIICLYAMLYSVERFFVESLRTDSLYICGFKQAQVLSICLIIISIILYIILKKRDKQQ